MPKQCPHCKSLNPDEFEKCQWCGKGFDEPVEKEKTEQNIKSIPDAKSPLSEEEAEGIYQTVIMNKKPYLKYFLIFLILHGIVSLLLYIFDSTGEFNCSSLFFIFVDFPVALIYFRLTNISLYFDSMFFYFLFSVIGGSLFWGGIGIGFAHFIKIKKE